MLNRTIHSKPVEASSPAQLIELLETRLRELESENKSLSRQLEKLSAAVAPRFALSSEERRILGYIKCAEQPVGVLELSKLAGISELRSHFLIETLMRKETLGKKCEGSQGEPVYQMSVLGQWLLEAKVAD